jgi:hypothetical protein
MRPSAVAAVSASSGLLIRRSGYTGQQPAPDGIIDYMSWASVSPTVLPLAGVIVGAVSTLLGQHLALRRDARREAAQRAVDQRAERKDAIIGFLSATERVEQHRGQHASELSLDEAPMIELMHAVWLAKKIIELVCSGTLAQAAQDYTLALNQASQELGPRGTGRRSPAMSSRERQFRREFVEAARREMGYAGEPLLRRTRAEDEQIKAGAPASIQPL